MGTYTIMQLQGTETTPQKGDREMTRAEQKVNSINKEIEKLEKSLERYTKSLNNKTEKCIKLDCNWTREEMFKKRESGEMTQKQWEAWFDRSVTESYVEDTQESLEKAFRRLEKANGECEKEYEAKQIDLAIANKEANWEALAQKKKEEYEKWLAEFKAECLKDGIIINEASSNWISGTTKGGKKFAMYINNGWTERSNHSYTLVINGVTYFTSGLFSTGYKYLMNN